MPSPLLLLALLCGAAVATCPGEPDVVELEDMQVGQWQVMYPGGNTMCGDGSPFAFLVKRGSSNKLYVELQGGGACWSQEECENSSFNSVDPTFTSMVDCQASFPGILIFLLEAQNALAFRPELADHTVVFVPYCTQDLHGGNSSHAYSDTFTYFHNGANNLESAMQYAVRNVPSPERVVVTGCSAGALGTAYATYRLSKLFNPLPPMSVFMDSELGVSTHEFAVNSFNNWGIDCPFNNLMQPYFPVLTEEFWQIPPTVELFMAAAMLEVSSDVRWFIYTSLTDSVQFSYFASQGGTIEQFVPWMVNLIDHFEALPNVRTFALQDGPHCTLAGSYAMSVADFDQWLLTGIDTTQPIPDNHLCATCTPETSAGCDGIVGSGLIHDSCLVCGGSGDSCDIGVPSWVEPAETCGTAWFPHPAEFQVGECDAAKPVLRVVPSWLRSNVAFCRRAVQ